MEKLLALYWNSPQRIQGGFARTDSDTPTGCPIRYSRFPRGNEYRFHVRSVSFDDVIRRSLLSNMTGGAAGGARLQHLRCVPLALMRQYLREVLRLAVRVARRRSPSGSDGWSWIIQDSVRRPNQLPDHVGLRTHKFR